MDTFRRDSIPSPASDETDSSSSSSVMNVPNLLSGLRFLGSFVLIGLALDGGGPLLLPLMVLLILSDWVDGKLAIALKQRTTFGARLDSLADVTFYGAVLFAMCWLTSALIIAEGAWVAPGIVCYGVSSIIGWFKFGQIPTYHTLGAKAGWLLGGLAILAIFAKGWGWPLRVVGIWILAVNIEAILITLILPMPKVDVPTLVDALMTRRRWLSSKNRASDHPSSFHP